MIAEATDHDTAMKFVLAFGGRRYRFAVSPKADSKIARAIGLDAAEKLCARFGDERIEVPLETTNLIFWLRDRGKSVEDISNRLRVSRRMVQYHLNDNVPRLINKTRGEITGGEVAPRENICHAPERA